MPKTKTRKRKTPVTAIVAHSSSLSSSSKPESSRAVIRRFHVLLKQKTRLEAEPLSHTAGQGDVLAQVNREIEELGGLDAYQRMSSIGQGSDRGGGSEKILIGWLKDIRDTDKATNKIKLLEVGALKPDNYKDCMSWIDVTPIDLHSRHPAILEQDFLKLDPKEHREQWDVISLSLIVNFVPDALDRGRMLVLAREFLRPSGHLFLALPLPCVSNSRYMTFEHLRSLMASIGFTQVHERWKQGGKMAYWLYRKQEPVSQQIDFGKKVVLREGNRNNFCILLRQSRH